MEYGIELRIEAAIIVSNRSEVLEKATTKQNSMHHYCKLNCKTMRSRQRERKIKDVMIWDQNYNSVTAVLVTFEVQNNDQTMGGYFHKALKIHIIVRVTRTEHKKAGTEHEKGQWTHCAVVSKVVL